MDTGSVISIILGVVALVAAAAAVAAVFKANLVKSTIEQQEKLIKALGDRVGFLETEDVRRNAELTTWKAKVDALQVENQTLQTYVSGTDAIRALAACLAENDKARQAEHHDITDLILAIPTILTAHHDLIVEMIRKTTHTHPQGTP